MADLVHLRLVWQILPLGPTSYGDSPYSSLSAFALNPYFIDLDMLVSDGLIDKDILPPERNDKKTDYKNLSHTRYNILAKAYERNELFKDEFIEFKKEEDYWLDSYANYMVLKDEQEGKPWYDFYNDFKYKNPSSMEWLKNEYKNKIDYYKFIQFIAFKQWFRLKEYANKKGIKIIGDMPIYCAYDSADVWANPINFQLNDNLTPKAVAGCPPDYFSPDGQLWGNPLYNWDYMKGNHYDFFVKRVKHSLKIYDILRIDHFRGFEAYYSIPYVKMLILLQKT